MIRFLVVEDEVILCGALREFFQGRGYEVYTAADGKGAMEVIDEKKPHLVFLDLSLPDMSGMDILRWLKNNDHTTKVIIITAHDDEDLIKEAYDLGACDYVVKPVTFGYLKDVALSKVRSQLFEDLRREHEELLKAYQRLNKAHEEFIFALVKVLEARDAYTGGHSESVTEYAKWIIEELQNNPSWTDVVLDNLKPLILHDIGKIGISDSILNKRAGLDEDEWEKIRQHPIIGAQILENVEGFRQYANIIRHHHERHDGKGYPDGLTDRINPIARILSVADAYDAITSDRPYRKAQIPDVAVKEILENRGKQFDPEVVDAFMSALKKRGIICSSLR